ncbi:NADPH-quinone oxidoreductase subunit U, chloroplastic [Cinnamomum micranthum f. kanehirae]|uniref:NADPH-quinone oxidoreductase subunit U, chloroplastic n=1 Tax=Cinnamomum micranthum f. kanehirae TaxID=337451 RepID=A0A443NLX9_9MAGN|nr:NADPH-quinone oxidoreductase subunit U, chloroplastic [Cinnamomum micranthum f. kanehirae]
MALSSTATICIPHLDPIRSPEIGNSWRFSARFPTRQHRFRIRNSAETSPSETTSATEENPETQTQSPVESSKGVSSLISATNVEMALRGIAITSADHYGRLGIARGTSYDQVTLAYRRRCEELMNKGLDEEEVSKELELLKESYAILSSEEERRLYDWSLARSEKPDRYVWPFEVDITQTPTQTPPPPEPEDVGPTRLVGYFLLAWLILSFALSVTLNR